MLVFELIDFDGPGSLQVRNQVFDFLLANEKKCVSLVARFLKRDTQIFYAIDERNVIWGVLSVSGGGQVLHCINSDLALPAFSEYFSENKYPKLFSIIGEKKFTDALAKVFLSISGDVSKSEIDYVLMEYNHEKAQELAANTVRDSKKKQFLDKCEIFDCKNSDFDQLLPLQKAYEIEEVLADKDTFNEKSSRITLRRALQDGGIFGIKSGGKIVGKASINAKGENYIQLGGVFTEAAFRNRGIATHLVKNLVKKFKSDGKSIALFVKKTNMSAISVYKNCGFETFEEYKIIYY